MPPTAPAIWSSSGWSWACRCGATRSTATRIEKRVLMPHGQNTVHLTYRLLSGAGPVRLTLRPSVQFRGYEAAVDQSPVQSYCLTAVRRRYELSGGPDFPCLRMAMHGSLTALTLDERGVAAVPYEIERHRGYAAVGALWSPGYFRASLTTAESATLVASTEPVGGD